MQRRPREPVVPEQAVSPAAELGRDEAHEHPQVTRARDSSRTPELLALLELAKSALPGGSEERPGQVAMALAAYDAAATGRHLVVQAGTGTGKSLAYLVACVLSGRKTVVSTTTKALQDQLANKDLPLVRKALGERFSFSVLKGRSNYLCRQRAAELRGLGQQAAFSFSGPSESAGDTGTSSATGLAGTTDDTGGASRDELRRLLDWAGSSATGERSDLDFEPSPGAWALLSVGWRECPGASACPSGDSCFAEAARHRAAATDIIVVNSHLYGAHLAGEGGVLPRHDVVVFDEVHDLEDVLTSSLATEISPSRLRSFAASCRPLLPPRRRSPRRRRSSSTGAPGDDQPDALAGLMDAAGMLERVLTPLVGKRIAASPVADDSSEAGATSEVIEEIGRTLAVAGERLGALLDAIAHDGPGNDRLSSIRTRAQLAGGYLTADLRATIHPDDGSVQWVEDQGGSPVLRSAPIEIASLLPELLWNKASCIMTSATVPPGLADRLGLDPAAVEHLDVGSPFNYEEHALLYCGTHLPDPRDPDAERALHDELDTLINAAGGRTLALFTSRRAMLSAARVLSPRLPYRILVQSDLPNHLLVKAFSEDESSCLFATMGFWQGVDVPGASLSLVVIDRIPFPRPDEPLMQARREAAGPAGFRSVDLARARVLLAQGAGRLVRNATDRGVVAVLDRRLAAARYGRSLIEGLPPMRFTTRRADAIDVLSSLRDSTGSGRSGAEA